MKNIRNIFILIAIQLITNFTLFSQIDFLSILKKEFKKSKNEKIKLKLLNQLSKKYWYVNFDSSVFYGKKAMLMAQKNNNEKEEANALNNISFAYYISGNIEKSLEIQISSLKIREKIKDSTGIILSNDNLYRIRLDLKEYNLALKHLEISEKIKIYRKDTSGLINSYMKKGNVYKLLKNFDKAKYYHNKAFEFSNSNNKNIKNFHKKDLELSDKNSYDFIIKNYLNLGSVYTHEFELHKKNLKLLDTANFFYKKILDISKELKDNSLSAEIYNKLGLIEISRKNYSKSIKYLKKSIKIVKKIYLKIDVSKNISFSYSQLNKFDSAYFYQKLFKNLSDSVISTEKNKQIIKMQIKYDSEKKDKENLLLKKDAETQQAIIKQQKIAVIFIIIVLILIIILAIIFLRGREKQRKVNKILESKNTEINQQKEEIQEQAKNLSDANISITKEKEKVEESHKQITDSINYAKLIQNAVLPDFHLFEKNFSDYFIFFKPRNIVSGDFFWAKKINDYIIIVAADCTGHGVPGAFVSMLGISFLNEICMRKEINQANYVLNALRKEIKFSLKQNKNSNNKDGMDIALCMINTKTNILQFSGANNPLYLFRDNKLIEFKADRQPIGIYLKERPFKNYKFQLEKDDKLYTFSDGYIDQFGGEKNKKFMKKRFKELLLKIQNKAMYEQKEILDNVLKNWKRKTKQIDDILIIGIKI